MPLLVLAASKNNMDLAAALLEKGADANRADIRSGDTALIKASLNANVDMLGLLANYNADFNASNKRGFTPILAAIESGDAFTANSLLARGARAGVSKEYLLAYAFSKNPFGIDIMLKCGAEPNYADANGNTPLIVAASAGLLESVQALIKYRARVDEANKFGMTPLLYAAKAKYYDIARELMNAKADVNKANKQGETPLYWAAYLGQDQLVSDLLLLKADYNAKTKSGITPLQIAEQNGHPRTAKLISDQIAFDNIPKDEKGRPIMPKKSSAPPAQTAANPLQTPSDVANSIPMPAPNASIPPTAAMAGQALPPVPAGMPPQGGGAMPAEYMDQIPPEYREMIAAQQQQQAAGAAAQEGQPEQSSSNWMKPKDLSSSGKNNKKK
jgi:ankyrin repeat protein